MQPTTRRIRGYGLDPGFSTRLDTAGINEVLYKIRFEPHLKPGPIGEYVEVVDFDPPSNRWYEPVDLNHINVASQLGVDPSEGNPQFHQQFVYAVAMKTIGHFETALGRKVIWSPRNHHDADDDHAYVGQIRIYPHALRDANAYYDAEKKALLFGYFQATGQLKGTNYPGGIVFTCLSPDIVAHEMTHAILDSIHPRYMEDTNPDVAAFHEGFADIVALLQRFTFTEIVEHQLYQADGRIDNYTALGELATQFGEALEDNRGALRSMIGTWNAKGKWEPLKPNPNDYRTEVEPHDRGALLVATVFDAFQRIFKNNTQDLVRIATQGTGILPSGRINVDLVRRLAAMAQKTAEYLLQICIRALDYCPPNDITFGDYLRALITADINASVEDRAGFRVALIEAFRARGIFPERLLTLSVASLTWDAATFSPKQEKIIDEIAIALKTEIRGLRDIKDRRELFKKSRELCAKLHTLLTSAKSNFSSEALEALLNQLGLTSKPVSNLFGSKSRKHNFLRYDDKKQQDVVDNNYVPKLEVHMIRPAERVNRDGTMIEQVLISLTQSVKVQVELDGTQRTMKFRGGCTLVLRSGADINIEYIVRKNLKSFERFERQRKYQFEEPDNVVALASTYDNPAPPSTLNFKHLHKH